MTMTLADAARIDDGVVTPRSDRPKRRTFTAEYKAAVLSEYEAADHGERGAILRREGLYSSHITEWRKAAEAAEAGVTAALGPKVRDRRERKRDREVEALRARAERAETELAKTRAALDLVGKAHVLLEMLAEYTGVKRACEVLGRPKGSHYRALQPRMHGPAPARPSPPNALNTTEQAQVLEMLISQRFCDKSVAQTWATLLDEGTYLCSQSTSSGQSTGPGAERSRRGAHHPRSTPARQDPRGRRCPDLG